MAPRVARIAGALVVSAVLAAGVSACGSSDEKAETTAGGGAATTATTATTDSPAASMEGKRVAFANLTDAGELTLTMKRGIESAAETLGVDLSTYDNKFDAAATLQNAKLMAQDKPDMILEWNPVAATAKSVERVFEQAGVKCIAVNTPGDGGCPWFNLHNATLCGDSGKAIGKVASDKGWSGRDTTVIMVAATKLGEALNTCLADFYFQLQDAMPGLHRVASAADIKMTTTEIGDSAIQVDTGSGLRAEAYEGVKNTLQSVDKSRNVIVYTLSDDAARGGWRAIQEAGREDRALTGGLGGDPAALRALRTNPAWVVQGDVFFPHWGQYLMAMSQAILDGAETPLLTISPTAALTKDFEIPGTTVAPISNYYEEGQDISSKLPPLMPVREGPTALGEGTVGNDYLAATGVLQQFGNIEGLE